MIRELPVIVYSSLMDSPTNVNIYKKTNNKIVSAPQKKIIKKHIIIIIIFVLTTLQLL